MADVFISYSRQNIAFAEKLAEALKDRELSAWVDWQNIPRSAGWWEEIKRGIDIASTFVFIMSADSLGSAVCTLELAHAIENGKRIIPVVIEPPNFEQSFGRIAAVQPDAVLSGMLAGRDLLMVARDNRTVIGHINWVFFGTTPQGEDKPYDVSLDELIETVNTDLTHNRRHARLLVRAREWEQGNRADDFLLIGNEVADAETWLAEAEARGKEPTPTGLQQEYITTSRNVEDRRRRLLRNLRVGTAVFAAVGVIAVILAVGSLITSQQAQSRAEVAATQAADAELREVDAQEQANLAGTQAANAETREADAVTAVVLADRQLMTATIAQGEAEQREAFAVTQAAQANATLTPIPQTLTPIAGTLQAGETQIAAVPPTLTEINQQVIDKQEQADVANTQVAIANSALTAVPPTLTQVAQLVQDGEALIESLRLASEAVNILNGLNELRSNAEMAALLSTRALRTAFTNQAYIALTRSVDNLYTHQIFTGHTRSVRSVALSSDNRHALSSSWDGTVRLWDVATGETLRTFTGHTRVVWSVAFSPDDDNYALSASWDNTLRLWDVATGETLRIFTGHTDSVYSAVFSSDGRYALSGSGDGTLRLWDVETGEELRTFTGHTSAVQSVAFSPDGHYALSSSWDGTVRL